jgi:octaprenyl-diphosphate synthase
MKNRCWPGRIFVDPDRAFLEKYENYFEEIDWELKNSFGCDIPIIDEIGRHSLLSEGKRVRPLLFILSSRLCGYLGDDVYRVSTIFEHIHSASLLHDDVIDNADMRRNKPSASRIWGNSAAVLAGDYLYTKAISIALETNNMKIFMATTDMSRRMIEGQFLELIHTDDWNMGKDEYTAIIISKTAELMSTACTCGALIADADEEFKKSLQKFGLNLGIAFQLVDDLLDYEASEKEFGKPVGKDLKEGKTTLPLIYALSKMDKKEVKRLEGLFKSHRANEKDYAGLIKFVRDSGAIDYIRTEARDYINRAARFLDVFPESGFKNDLLTLNEYIAERRL